jgi:aldose 1-epimerase
MTATITPFGQTAEGRPVQAIRLTTPELTATILTYGAALNDLRLAGLPHSLTLGGPEIAAYQGPMGYFGTIVGPVANRLGKARATIAGQDYAFAPNDGGNLLHGGRDGIQTRIWTVTDASASHLRLTLALTDGEDGFPANRIITAEYQAEGAALTLHLGASTDAPTLMNLAHHGYWNPDGAPTTRGLRLTVAADRYLPVDAALLPLGEVRAVHGSFDLRKGRVIDLSEGLDHNFCLARAPRALTEVASLAGQSATLHLATTEPGLQIYEGAGVNSAPFPGHGGTPYGAFAGIAMEPQRWPDAPHNPSFPPITLAPGETYRQTTRWRFTRG